MNITEQKRIEFLTFLHNNIEKERAYQLENWCGSDIQERYIRHLGSVMRDIQLEKHKIRRYKNENN